jgi:hypothetical protein
MLMGISVQYELLRAKLKQEFLNAKKHTVALQLLREHWCTKIDYLIFQTYDYQQILHHGMNYTRR